jgi:hypothetical protein
MSRSHRKTPKIGITTAESDKPYKEREHRRERRTVRSALHSTLDGDDRRLNRKHYGDDRHSEKDGQAIRAQRRPEGHGQVNTGSWRHCFVLTRSE